MKKQRPSRLLAAVITEIDKPVRMTKGTKAILDFLGNYPFNFREDVFCWLWANHTQVLGLRTRWDRMHWDSIAIIMHEDGVKGARGEPPNGNSVRRVWGRVCRELEEQEERKRREAVNGKRVPGH